MFLVQLVGSLTKSSRIFSIRYNRYSNSLGRQPISVVYRDDVVLLHLHAITYRILRLTSHPSLPLDRSTRPVRQTGKVDELELLRLLYKIPERRWYNFFP